MQRNSPGAARGGPVVLRSVMATPCYFHAFAVRHLFQRRFYVYRTVSPPRLSVHYNSIMGANLDDYKAD